jgi:hypothetical protein
MTDPGPPSEFERAHRMASEWLLFAVHGYGETDTVLRAIEAEIEALNHAENDAQRTLAMGLIRAALDLRMMTIMRGEP